MEMTIAHWHISIHVAAAAARTLRARGCPLERAVAQERGMQIMTQQRERTRLAYLLQGGR